MMTKNEYLNDPDVVDFVGYFARLINNEVPINHQFIIKKGGKNSAWVKSNKGYEWNCDNLKSACTQYFWGIGDFKTNNEELTELSKNLKAAIKLNNEKEVLSLCLKILEWGGVKNGAYGVAKSYCNGKLISSITNALAALTPDADTQLDLNGFCDKDESFIMNASFTKIYSLLSEQPFIIYDSRVAAALSLIVSNYWINVRQDNEVLPNYLRLACLEGRAEKESRCASDEEKNIIFRNVNGNNETHALWNVRANWIIESALIQANLPEGDIIQNMRELEASLFMIGYNVAV